MKTESRDVKKDTCWNIGWFCVKWYSKIGLNKNADINIKIRKYPGASSTAILDHIKPSLRKEPDQIVIHAGTNNLTNNHIYLNNVKKIAKMVRETCKNAKLCFPLLICWTDEKVDEKAIKTNIHLENYYK